MGGKLNFKKFSVHKGPKESPGFLLWHISTSWRSSIEAVLKTLELTHPQFVVLATTGWLTRKGDFATQAAIGKMAGLDPNTISQIITGLEKKDLIKRESSSDGRAKNPKLTTRGNELIVRALPAVEDADRQFFDLLSAEELENLACLFQKLMGKHDGSN